MTKRSREESESDIDGEDNTIGENSATTYKTNLTSTRSLLDTTRTKYIQLDPETIVPSSPVMRCSLPPHQEVLAFTSYEAYEVHYAKVHTNRCLECSKNFPTDHFLSLHIEENHDALFSVKRERGDKMFACFVEDCDRRCSTPHKRRMHLIDKHMFPKEYDFHIVTHGISSQSSMLQSRKARKKNVTSVDTTKFLGNSLTQNYSPNMVSSRGSTPSPTDQGSVLTIDTAPVSNTCEDTGMEDLSKAMCALKFVPSSVRFGGRGRGRGSGRSGLSRYR